MSKIWCMANVRLYRYYLMISIFSGLPHRSSNWIQREYLRALSKNFVKNPIRAIAQWLRRHPRVLRIAKPQTQQVTALDVFS
ncbi:hypothetical protein ACN38_g12950 [Penicillium nordicum]|uniref:Uncharacterized protein n=1 Tax=Penicillium nordicum TaxID=229535 RepID=A0A0M9W9T2_9EURO|nr:hypothetical protein ACN38_g12950 [Penicillium nordicum]